MVMEDHRSGLGNKDHGDYMKTNTRKARANQGGAKTFACCGCLLSIIQNPKFILNFHSFTQALCLSS